jgi:hypothetical protein
MSGSGSVCSKHFVKTPTMSGTASTARSIALTSTQPEQKGRPNTADGKLQTVGHGHGHGHVYAETAAFRDTPFAG